MNPSSIPPYKVKSKERTFFAILLAVIVHIVIAVIIYFTVFYNKNLSQSVQPHSIHPPVNQPMHMEMTEDLQAADSAITTDQKNGDDKPSQTNATQTANDTEQSGAANRQQAENVTKRMTNEARSASSVSDNDSHAAMNDLTLPATDAATTSEADQALSPMDKATDTAEYKLKKTDDYKRREAEVDKDNEQLSKLINEVKRRNQTQIQHHQTPKTAPHNNDDTPVIKPDYQITPIIPSTSVAAEAAAENRMPTTQIPATNN